MGLISTYTGAIRMLRVTLEVSLKQLYRILWIVLLLKGAGLI
jgi:hypothetical protein